MGATSVLLLAHRTAPVPGAQEPDDAIFTDGFESGDTSARSTVVP